MKTTRKQVDSLINCLTDNEDLRQDLWLHYLGGAPVESFPDQLESLQTDSLNDEKINCAAWQIMNDPPSDKFFQILDGYTNFERTLLTLMILGLSAQDISTNRGISLVRIKQALSSLRYN